MNNENIEEMVFNQETLKIYHDQKIETILKAYPPERGFNVEIIECIPIDSKTEKITFKVTKKEIIREAADKVI